jgi:hypothetical protein
MRFMADMGVFLFATKVVRGDDLSGGGPGEFSLEGPALQAEEKGLVVKGRAFQKVCERDRVTMGPVCLVVAETSSWQGEILRSSSHSLYSPTFLAWC